MTVDDLVRSFEPWKFVRNVRVTYHGHTVLLTTETLKRWFGNESVTSFDTDFINLDDESIYPHITYPNNLKEFEAAVKSKFGERKE